MLAQEGQYKRREAIRLDFNQAIDVDPKEPVLDELARQARMITLGRLAAGAVHDMRSFLRVADMYWSLGVEDIEKGDTDAALKHLARLKAPFENLQCLCDDLLNFGAGRSAKPSLVMLRETVDATAKMLRAVFSCIVRIEVCGGVKSGEPELCVHACKHQVQQMIVNLVQNAMNAYGNKSGTITITVHKIRRFKEDEELLPGSVKRGFVGFTVSDTAGGMGAETLALLQDPHFSTKPTSQGYGLGLYTVRYIASKLGGTLAVSSEHGIGSAFTVYLPPA